MIATIDEESDENHQKQAGKSKHCARVIVFLAVSVMHLFLEAALWFDTGFVTRQSWD